jgi:hypothetical protein
MHQRIPNLTYLLHGSIPLQKKKDGEGEIKVDNRVKPQSHSKNPPQRDSLHRDSDLLPYPNHRPWPVSARNFAFSLSFTGHQNNIPILPRQN